MGTMVLKWPFMHPGNFCPPNPDGKGWLVGHRLSSRCLSACSAYHFVKCRVSDKQPSQRLASSWASRGTAEADQEDCLDPAQDPMGLLTGDWAMYVSGLDLAIEDGTWTGLTQLRWVSSRAEGRVSAASATLCSRVAPPAFAPAARHVVVNCSSGSVRGHQGDIEAARTSKGGKDELVVHELRHVARLSWQLDARAPSFFFLQWFVIRYKELPPGKSADACEWRELQPAPLADVCDATDLAEGATTPLPAATFTFDVVAAVPLLRFHHYIFSVQVRTPEHDSPWSKASDPLHLMLPEVLPRAVALKEEDPTEVGSEEWSEESEGPDGSDAGPQGGARRQGMEPEAEEAPNLEPEAREAEDVNSRGSAK
ncbi:unnamed protein product, partial [Polarella glacialis]